MNTTSDKHPLALFHYCPKCGSKHFVENNAKSKRCETCGFIYYLNPSAACTCFIMDRTGNLLVATRKYPPAEGTYDLPGGFADIGESIEETMAREIMEETGIDVNAGMRGGIHSPLKYLFSLPNTYLYSGFEIPTLDYVFYLQVETLVPYVGEGHDDVAELSSIPLKDLDPSKFGLDSIQKAVSMVMEQRYW
ncbi:MAG: NUDIX domain-containing protein [Porphyromonas sp.]|nr:NUDIX domain-containing protein [Porphyromonas sp.]